MNFLREYSLQLSFNVVRVIIINENSFALCESIITITRHEWQDSGEQPGFAKGTYNM